MTNGQRVAMTALALTNPQGRIRERGINTDFGGWIDQCQRFWGMGRGTSIGAQPWCGMGQDEIFRTADVDDSGICHPSTAEMCRRADRLGGLRPKGSLVHPGTILILCGTHTTTVVQDRGNGLLDCVGANENDQVGRSTRSKSWGRLIEVPGLREGSEENLREYWFEDPRYDPEYFGPWGSRAARERTIVKNFAKENRHGLVRRVKSSEKGAKFGFWVFSGKRWIWGPWVGQEGEAVQKNRDALQKDVERDLGRTLRSRSRPIAAQGYRVDPGDSSPSDTKTT